MNYPGHFMGFPGTGNLGFLPVESVVIFAQTSEDEYKHSSFTEEFKTTKSTIHHDIGEHFLVVEAACTQYAANIIAEQMKLALSVKYMISQHEEMMQVNSPNESLYVVKLCHDSGGSVCSCAFYKTMCIPCRHIFLKGIFCSYHFSWQAWYHSVG